MLCPVAAIIQRVKHIMAHTTDLDIMLGSYFERNKSIKSITSYLVNTAVRAAARHLNLEQQGLQEKSITSHSLRAGGAMALHLAGASDNTVKKMGRWSTDTFLMYIHEQIAVFSNGLSAKMSTSIPFHNVAF